MKSFAGLLLCHESKWKNGQSLIEAVVALAVLLLTLGAITTVIVTAVSNTTFTKNQNLANKTSQQIMEYIRNTKVNNNNFTVIILGPPTFLKFTSLLGNYCIDSLNTLTATALECAAVDSASGFKQNVNVVPPPGGCVWGSINGTSVVVKVKWSSSKCPAANQYCHQAALASCFTQRSGGL